jgi:phosphoheptose isomerase
MMSFFPTRPFPDAAAYGRAYFDEIAKAASGANLDALAAAGEVLLEASRTRAHIFSCGNGGSAAIANHLACDCMKGVQAGTALLPRVHSLSSNIELISAIVNDIGVEEMFSHQLRSLAHPGDVLVAISSSGESPNILRAIGMARELGVKTIALTGFDGGAASRAADVSIHVPAANYGVAEDIHQSMMHILAQYVRHRSLSEPSMLGKVKF